MHIPVLLQESIDGLQLAPGMNCIDATVGEGGHTRKLLEKIAPNGRVIGFDRDRTSLFLAVERLQEFGERFIPIHDTFAHLKEHQEEIQLLDPIRAIVADLGLSSFQLDSPERGFAFRLDAPLDMRFDEASEEETAATLLATASEEHLAGIFREYGEERHARRIAREIVEMRENEKIETTAQLAELIENTIGRKRPGHSHPATRVFQALRIAVNHELEHVQAFLPQAIDVLAPGGRLAVITFHSIEDRIVKQTFKHAAAGCICPPELPECRCEHTPSITLVTKKPIVPTSQEQKQNPRCRSAKLRIIQKI